MAWWLVWWVWLGVALVLGVLETLVTGWVFLGFSGGAVVTAALVALGVDWGIGGTLVGFALISGVIYAGLRAWLGASGRGTARIVTEDLNDYRPKPPPEGR